MNSELMSLPPGAKISFIRSALERERRMRSLLKGDSRVKGIEEMSICLKYLDELKTDLKV